MKRFLKGLALTATALCVAFAANAAPLLPDQQDQVRAIVREYLLKNPELLEEMQAALELKRAQARWERLAPALARDPRRFGVGPSNAKITVVEFFDYRCPYCKSAFDWTNAAIKANRDVRFVFVEFPILGPNSLEASKAAVASMKQGKYLPFHDAMMRSKSQLESRQIDAIARTVGVDVGRMRRDMADPAIMQLLGEDQEIAAGEAINATPTFMINGQLFSGFRPDEMDKALRRLKSLR